MRSAVSVLVLSFLIVDPVRSQGPDPVDEQIQVNTYTTDSQINADVVVNPDGSFVVVWESYGSTGTDSDYLSLQAQRFDAGGTPAGNEFQVNSYTTGYQYQPVVAADIQGNFVVVWGSYGSDHTDTDYLSIQAQLYDAGGAPMGGQFQINSYTTGYQWQPAVATESKGSFVVVWESTGSSGTDSDYQSIQARRYDAGGTPAGEQFQVNSYTTSFQWRPAVSADAQGNFVAAWTSNGSPGTDPDNSIQSQLFDASNSPVGDQIQVNSYTTGTQRQVAVAARTQGDFVVVWESYGSYDTDIHLTSIQAQLYDAGGTPMGGQFQVNTYTLGKQWSPSVNWGAQGEFAVLWRSDGSHGTDTDSSSIQGQLYDLSGTPVGGEFQVNSYTTSSQWNPAVATNSHGDLVAVWNSSGSLGSDTDQAGIQGQRFVGSIIFTDGFESGDTLEWSGAMP